MKLKIYSLILTIVFILHVAVGWFVNTRLPHGEDVFITGRACKDLQGLISSSPPPVFGREKIIVAMSVRRACTQLCIKYASASDVPAITAIARQSKADLTPYRLHLQFYDTTNSKNRDVWAVQSGDVWID